MPPRKRPGRGDSLIGTTYWSQKVRPRILKRDRNRCQACGGVFPPSQLDVDHIVPRQLGGTDRADNLRALCKPCHKARRAATSSPRPLRPETSWQGVPVHTHHPRPDLPTIRGDTNAGTWEGEGCPPGCIWS